MHVVSSATQFSGHAGGMQTQEHVASSKSQPDGHSVISHAGGAGVAVGSDMGVAVAVGSGAAEAIAVAAGTGGDGVLVAAGGPFSGGVGGV